MADTKNEYTEIAKQIYDRHADTVYSVCFMYMKNSQDAEDAVSNTFLKLLEKKKNFDRKFTEWALESRQRGAYLNLIKDFDMKTNSVMFFIANRNKNFLINTCKIIMPCSIRFSSCPTLQTSYKDSIGFQAVHHRGSLRSIPVPPLW